MFPDPLFRICSLACALALGCSPSGPRHATFDPAEKDYYLADPQVGHLHQPHALRRMAWKEHPRGRIDFRTNNLGFREDRDTSPRPEPGIFRILATGDSHSDGVVWNDESFPNRLELFLNLAAPAGGRHFEVINGGVGYYGPFEYRRFMAREQELEPDLLLVNVFLGNDFLDACRDLEATTELGRPRPSGYIERLVKARDAMSGTVAQSLNQLFYFKTFPHMIEPAIAASAEQLGRLNAEAAAAGRPLLVTLQPSLVEVSPADPRVAEHLALAADLLGIGAAELELQARLRNDLRSRLEAAGVHTIDLYPAFAADPQGLFWEWDEHLAVRGHEKLAGILCTELAATEDLPCVIADPRALPIFADGFESGDISRWSLGHGQ